MHNFSGTVCLLVLGQPFRSGIGLDDDNPCNRSSYDPQREATTSIVEAIANPISRKGHNVEVFMTYPSGCALATDLISWFRPYKTHHTPVVSNNIQQGWQGAYRLLSEKGSSCDYVLQLRHDVHMDVSFDMWNFDPNKIQFERECVDCAIMMGNQPGGSCTCGQPAIDIRKRAPASCKETCTADHLLWFPRQYKALMTLLVVHRDVCCHSLIRHVHRRTGYSHYGFMFPENCADDMTIPLVVCDETSAYRHSRIRSRKLRTRLRVAD